ncbi:MAG: radical SAM protein [Kiritimatiellales bacterium]
MKVMIGYPGLPSEKGIPLLSQNRQFQWFNKPTFIYPMVPAYAASMAKEAGHEVFWADGIAEQWSSEEFERYYLEFSPDFFLMETKTPVIKTHWKIIKRLKEICPGSKVVLCGDHVTALPEESMQACPVDYVLTGGDYDFLFNELINGEALPPGVWYRESGVTKNSGAFELNHDLNHLPFLDRELTKWDLYARENGNFRYTPGTYTMVGRDCWWGKCSFCSWTTLYNNWRVQSPQRALDEIGHILDLYPVKEIFDDTGCFPAGKWLKEFCEGFIARGYHKRVVMGCNMIPGILTQELYDLMSAANFRFVLFGLESADQATLERINKCGKARDIENSMQMAQQAGLEPHVTCMVGYPWETREQAQATVDFTKRLFDQGTIDTLQATVVIPYPGTPLFKECQQNGWLKTEDWDRYDMREPVMNTMMGDAEVMDLTQGIYKSFLTPRFIWRKIKKIRGWSDVLYYWKAGSRVLGHLMDFKYK